MRYSESSSLPLPHVVDDPDVEAEFHLSVADVLLRSNDPVRLKTLLRTIWYEKSGTRHNPTASSADQTNVPSRWTIDDRQDRQ